MMRRIVRIVLCVLTLLQFEITSVKAEELLKVRAWQAPDVEVDGLTSADFPESTLLEDRPNTAIGFSGGGARAFVGAMGYLSALHELDILKNVRYIGGISGGSWATSTYVFTQKAEVDDETLLGRVVQPEDITLAGLEEMDENCARGFARGALMADAIEALEQGLVTSVAEAWCYGVGQVYLEPVGIPKKMRFSWNEETVNDIKARNPQLAEEPFVTPLPEKKRPFPVIGTTVVGPSEGAPYGRIAQNYTMLDITPLYVGQMSTLDVEYMYRDEEDRKLRMRVGGSVEPFAFALSEQGSNETIAGPAVGIADGKSSSLLSVPAPTTPIDLHHAAGASSYATAAFFDALPHDLAEILSLEFDYWSPTTSDTPEVTRTMFADGGTYQNIPLINFMQRRVPKIVLFYMSSVPLQPFENWNVTTDPYSDDQVTSDLSAFFGALCTDCEPYWMNVSYEYEMNQVFSTDDYAMVITALQTKQQEGKGIVATFNLTTVENKWWGIPAGLTFEITFSYLGRLPQWESQLSEEMYDLVVPLEDAQDLSHDRESGPFHDFPHYATGGGGIDYSRSNLLADLTGWSVLQNAEEFRRMLS